MPDCLRFPSRSGNTYQQRVAARSRSGGPNLATLIPHHPKQRGFALGERQRPLSAPHSQLGVLLVGPAAELSSDWLRGLSADGRCTTAQRSLHSLEVEAESRFLRDSGELDEALAHEGMLMLFIQCSRCCGGIAHFMITLLTQIMVKVCHQTGRMLSAAWSTLPQRNVCNVY